MRLRIAVVVPMVLTGLAVLGLALLSDLMRPLKPGSSAELFQAVCGVSLDGANREIWLGEVETPPRYAVYYYEMQGLNRSVLRWVSSETIDLDLPRAVKLLEEREATSETDDFYRAGYRAWKALPEDQKHGASGLFASILDSRRNYLRKNSTYDFDAYRAVTHYRFELRIAQTGKYWSNFAFEFLFLAGLAWFVAWPAIREARPWRWALHVGLAPLLWLTPVYLGYAEFTFTGTGPSGGVLYPWLVRLSRGGRFNDFDLQVVGRLPRILEPISLSIGEPAAVTGQGMPGPTMQIVNGIVVAAIVFVFGIARERFALRRLAAGVRVVRPTS